MKKHILPFVFLSAFVAARANAVVVPPDTVNVPDVTTTSLLLGVSAIGFLVGKRFLGRR